MRVRARRLIARPHAQLLLRLVDARIVRSPHHLAWVHAIVRIPQCFELAERLHQLRAKHLRQQCAARLSVAVLAGERSAELEHDVGGAVDKFAIRLYAFHRAEVIAHTRVDAALPEVPVDGHDVSEFLHQRVEFAQIGAELCRRYGRVFPSLPELRHAGNTRNRAESRFAHAPHALRLLPIHTFGLWRHRPVSGGCDEALRLGAGIVIAISTKLNKQEPAASRQQCDVLKRHLLAAQEVDQHAVEAFEPDRLVVQDLRHGVCGEERIGEAQHNELAVLRALHQPHGRFQHGHARGLGPDQGARNVEAILRQQLVEVVAGDATGNLREALTDKGCVGIAEALQSCVDCAGAPACGDRRLKRLVTHRPERHASAVIEQDVERFDVVDRLPAHQCVHATGIVADHAADGAPIVGCGIRSEGQLAAFGLGAQRIEHDSGFDACAETFVVDGHDAAHVLREIEHYGDVAAVARNAGAAAA